MKNMFGTQGPPGWLVTGGMACVALAYVFFFFLPAQKAMKAARLQLAEKQTFITQTNTLYATTMAANDEFEQTSAFVTQWQQNAPNVDEAASLQSQVSSKAKLAGVRILRMEKQTAKPHGLIVEFPILMSVEGNFESIFNFLKGVEELPQTIWMQDVNLHRPSELGGDLRCDMTLTILGDLAEKSD